MWKEQAEKCFEGWEASLLHAYFRGNMGILEVDSKENPMAAFIHVGDFCFLAGAPSTKLLQKIQGPKLLVPRDSAWERQIEAFYGEDAKRFTRYAIKKEPDGFDCARLRSFVNLLDSAYELRLFDREIFDLARREEWSWDLCSQFQDYEAYSREGIGMAILCQGALVAGASPYAVYADGIEIEIDTKAEYRNRGLATVCASALILECLDRGIYPGWDAHDARSLALAEKLGYHLDYPYTAYELKCVSRCHSRGNVY